MPESIKCLIEIKFLGYLFWFKVLELLFREINQGAQTKCLWKTNLGEISCLRDVMSQKKSMQGVYCIILT